MLATATAVDESAPAPRLERLRAAVLAPLRWLAILVVPDRAVPATVREGSWLGPTFAATVLAVIAALAVASHVDLKEQVLAPPMGGPPPAAAAPGKPDAGMSDREFAEALAKARTVEQVKDGLGAAALPLELFALALAFYGLGGYVGGKPTVRKTMALAACAAMPGAVKSALTLVAVAHRAAFRPADVAALVTTPWHPAGRVAAMLVAGVDPFYLWSIAILAIGLPAAAGLTRVRALVTVLVGSSLWLVVTRIILHIPSPPPGAHP